VRRGCAGRRRAALRTPARERLRPRETALTCTCRRIQMVFTGRLAAGRTLQGGEPGGGERTMKITRSILIGSIGLLGVACLYAQPPGRDMPRPTDPGAMHGATHGNWAKATDLVGKEVRDSQGNRLGKLNNCIADMGAARILFGTIDGDAIGKNDQLIPVPITMFKLAQGADHLTLNATKDQLAAAPVFGENAWPNMTDPKFVQQVNRHFNQSTDTVRTVGEGHAEAGRWAKTSDLVGKEVHDAQDNKVGSLQNVIVDLGTGQILFGALPGDYVDKDNQVIPVPFQIFKLSADAKYLTIATSKADLAAAPAFNANQWPNLNDPQYLERVYSHFKVKPQTGEKQG
jgi:sporulation protein YlmC with PRC-barrel domain